MELGRIGSTDHSPNSIAMNGQVEPSHSLSILDANCSWPQPQENFGQYHEFRQQVVVLIPQPHCCTADCSGSKEMLGLGDEKEKRKKLVQGSWSRILLKKQASAIRRESLVV